MDYGLIYFIANDTTISEIDAKGEFEIHLPPGNYQFIVKNIGNTDLIVDNLNFETRYHYTLTLFLGTKLIH